MLKYLFLDYFFSYFILFILVWNSLFLKNIFTELFSHRLHLTYILLSWLIFLVFIRIILGRVPYNFLFGVNGFIIFFLSWGVWFRRYFASFLLKLRFFINISLFVLFLFLFDNFVVLLRPVTLTLRVFINISLGHFLILMLHIRNLLTLFLVFLIEIFVYSVQTYVYLTLSKSYLERLN